jgi:hypothetical protein
VSAESGEESLLRFNLETACDDFETTSDIFGSFKLGWNEWGLIYFRSVPGRGNYIKMYSIVVLYIVVWYVKQNLSSL